MRIVLSAGSGGDWRAEIARVRSIAALDPFSPVLVAFVEALSTRILTSAETRAYPDLLALAHWFRPIATRSMRARFDRMRQEDADADGGPRAPRGTVFHVAPGNVDLVFAYPWLLALLVGDGSIVRLSRRSGPSAALLLRTLDALLDEPAHAPLRARSLVLTYDPDAAITEAIGRASDMRILWGSDATIAELRAIPTPPYVRDIVFPDRFSWAAVAARAVLDATEDALAALADRFTRDVFLFDQLACSSPRALAWIGSMDDIAHAEARFWTAIDTSLAARPRARAPGDDAGAGGSAAIARFGSACALAATHPGARITTTPTYTRVAIAAIDAAARHHHDGFGVVLETRFERVTDLARAASRADQTLAHFGFSEGDLDALALATRGQGFDRFVPIGDALTFDLVWDGEDLLRALTRAALLRRG